MSDEATAVDPRDDLDTEEMSDEATTTDPRDDPNTEEMSDEATAGYSQDDLDTEEISQATAADPRDDLDNEEMSDEAAPVGSLGIDEIEMDVLPGHIAFANELYQLMALEPGNIFFSPIGLHATLAMVYQGAKEDTAKTLAKVLQVPSADPTAVAYKGVLKNFKEIQKSRLNMGNQIYVTDQKEISEEFEKTVKDYFDTQVESVDFHQKKETAGIINRRTSEVTCQTMKEIVDAETVNENVGMVLISSVYFRPRWNQTFAKVCKERGFYASKEKVLPVTMLRGRIDGYYKDYDDLVAEILVIRFKNNRTQMVLILPRELTGLANVEARLSTRKLTDVLNHLERTTVYLSLPKFQFNVRLDLDRQMRMLGLRDMFNEQRASFDGIFKRKCNKDSLAVGKVLQSAVFYIKDDYRGVEKVVPVSNEACAYEKEEDEASDSQESDADLSIMQFLVDHPAIFMIIDHDTSGNVMILFMGRIYEPQEGGEEEEDEDSFEWS